MLLMESEDRSKSGKSARSGIPDMDDMAALPDPLVEEEPSDIDVELGEYLESVEAKDPDGFLRNFARASAYDAVKWPKYDENAPDYASVATIEAPATFLLTAEVLDRLIALNYFVPEGEDDTIAIALRGATLADGLLDVETVDEATVMVTRPDHINFKCLIGFFFRKTRKLSLYTGSTVPCRKAIFGYVNGGMSCNVLPNGLYSYYVWRHKTIKPALRLAVSNASLADLEAGQSATVLRTKNDYILGTKDIWDPSRPLDNVHCSYYLTYNPDLGSYFSSWGCLTIRGKKTGTDQWGKFQKVLSKIGQRSRLDLMLLTGKDAALAAAQLGDGQPAGSLVRLRVGSQGQAVLLLQQRLGLGASGYFGYATRARLTEFQRELTGQQGEAWADGVYSPAFDLLTGWDVFSAAPLTRLMLKSEVAENAGEGLAADALRALPPDEYATDEPSKEGSTRERARPKPRARTFTIEPANEPQQSGVSFYATEESTGERFFVAKSTRYVRRRGLARSSILLIYDRFQAANQAGAWAHFIWPTAMGESNARHLTINSYDRAHFTWGFFQLAAHTPKDNLILLMRELLGLSSAAAYFPDLKLVNGRVHQMTSSGEVDLEHEEAVPIGSQTGVQIPRFMRYLNPDSYRVDNAEVLTAAKFVHWSLNDPKVIEKTIEVALRIVKRKMNAFAQRYDLFGRRPELAIWVLDMFHQGRGSVSQVKAALQLSSFSAQLDALSILSDLEDSYGFDVESAAHRGDTVEDMAYSDSQLDDFARRVEKVLRTGVEPRAILLSGGGNDVAGDEFAMLLNHATSSIAGLNQSIVTGIIDQRIRDAYVTILSAITEICKAHLGHPVPIVIHGYDYPVPDGRGFLGGWGPFPGPWLEPGFRQKGYSQMSRRKQICVELIDRFDTMLAGLAGTSPFGHVKFLDLRNTLATGSTYKTWWANELHPTAKGFEAVTKKFAGVI